MFFKYWTVPKKCCTLAVTCLGELFDAHLLTLHHIKMNKLNSNNSGLVLTPTVRDVCKSDVLHPTYSRT